MTWNLDNLDITKMN